jgi:hypothetical protein
MLNHVLLSELSKWIELSNARSIEMPNGSNCKFWSTRKYLRNELVDIEQLFNVNLTEVYRQLLSDLGTCVLFVRQDRPKESGIEINDPNLMLRGFAMKNPNSLREVFQEWLLIGLVRSSREIIGIDATGSTDTLAFSREVTNNWSRFELISPRTMPANDWLTQLIHDVSV